MKSSLEHSAKKYDCSIYELTDPNLDYPEEIVWYEPWGRCQGLIFELINF